MGLTIVQRSDLRVRKPGAKVALVLAGGAVSGGAYELGGLKALNDYLLNRKVTDFDVYVGLSAGAFLAAPLAAGISPEEMLKSLDARSESFTPLGFWDFYNPNLREIVAKPLEGLFDLLSIAPKVYWRTATALPSALRRSFFGGLKLLAAHDSTALEELAQDLRTQIFANLKPRGMFSYLPSGLCDNVTIERYLRANFAANDAPNHFEELKERTGKSLFVLATLLDTAELVVFGPGADVSVSISEAVQASTALPGFYKPAHLRGRDYIDGGVCKTANISVAVENGADLVICYNPFRPFFNSVQTKVDPRTGLIVKQGRPLADDGVLYVLNQVFRTVIRSRLMASLRRYREDPNFHGDIILVEPADYDYKFFGINPVAFWYRARSARHGFESVKKSIEREYGSIRQILSSYGIEMTRKYIQDDMTLFEASGGDTHAILGILQTEKPAVNMRLVGNSAAGA